MLSARSEHRLLLRQDNADLRLGGIGSDIGLLTGKRKNAYTKLKKHTERALALISSESTVFDGEKMKIADAVKRGMEWTRVARILAPYKLCDMAVFEAAT